jgi:hypothetical protein
MAHCRGDNHYSASASANWRLTRRERDATEAKELLAKFEEILASHTADRDRLLKELNELQK